MKGLSVIFRTTLENGVVDVHWSYERDDQGIYNTGIDKVMYQGIDIMPCLSDEVCAALDIEGCQTHEKWTKEQFDD
jgi:hypothetical protein